MLDLRASFGDKETWRPGDKETGRLFFCLLVSRSPCLLVSESVGQGKTGIVEGRGASQQAREMFQHGKQSHVRIAAGFDQNATAKSQGRRSWTIGLGHQLGEVVEQTIGQAQGEVWGRTVPPHTSP